MAELLTTKEAGDRLDISPQRVLQLIHDGRLPAVMFGKAYMIDAKDLPRVESRISGWPKGRPRGTPTAEHKAAMMAGKRKHQWYDEPEVVTMDETPVMQPTQPLPQAPRRRVIRAPRPRPSPQPA